MLFRSGSSFATRQREQFRSPRAGPRLRVGLVWHVRDTDRVATGELHRFGHRHMIPRETLLRSRPWPVGANCAVGVICLEQAATRTGGDFLTQQGRPGRKTLNRDARPLDVIRLVGKISCFAPGAGECDGNRGHFPWPVADFSSLEYGFRLCPPDGVCHPDGPRLDGEKRN